MTFMQKCKAALIRFMTGRHGADQLGTFTLIAGLILSLIASFTGLSFLSFLGFALYVITLFRMFSRNHEARNRENRKYLELTGGWTTKCRQFARRMKNRKDYKYFRCPHCRQLLRMKRGAGEKNITCARCGHAFTRKS